MQGNTEQTELALLKQQLQFEKEIRITQAAEYERRLGELNHSHAEAIRVQATYIGEDLYDRDHRELSGRVDKLERQAAEQRGQYTMVALVITIALTVLTVAINIFLKFVGTK